jgi:hypothetical protein
MNGSRILFLVLLLFVSACPQARPLVIGLPEMEPYAVEKGQGYSGIYVDKVRELMDSIGVAYTLRVLPVNRTIHELSRGNIDASIFLKDPGHPSQAFVYSRAPIDLVRFSLMMREGSGRKISMSQLKHMKVGALKGFLPGHYQLNKEQVWLLDSRDRLLKVLFADRVELILAEERITQAFALEHKFPKLQSLLQFLGEQPAFMVFSRKSLGQEADALAEVVSQALSGGYCDACPQDQFSLNTN